MGAGGRVRHDWREGWEDHRPHTPLLYLLVLLFTFFHFIFTFYLFTFQTPVPVSFLLFGFPPFYGLFLFNTHPPYLYWIPFPFSFSFLLLF